MASQKTGPKSTAEPGVTVIKKYANRRLYNTATSSYVTLDELCLMVREGEDFVVFDAKSSEDITRSVLTQIILEEDGKGRNLLPVSFLRQIIGYYDDSMRAFVPRYLEVSMENFSQNQDKMRSYMEDTFGKMFPLAGFEDMAKQNMSMFQNAMSMLAPFQQTASVEPESAQQKSADNVAKDTDISELSQKLEMLQDQIERLKKQG